MSCQGNCEEHVGPVVRVRIGEPGGPFDGMEFDYCQTAIEEDISRGFTVEILEITE